MKIKREFILKKLNENTENEINVVIAVGAYAKNINGYIKLNETAVFLWNILISGATKQDLVNALIKEYEVDKTLAETDVDAFILKLTQIGALND